MGVIWEFIRFNITDAREWCRGRWWIPRLPVLALFAWILLHHWMVSLGMRSGPYCNFFFGLFNLLIHEAGHLLFRFFGDFIYMAGGTILQLAAPMASVFVFRKQRDYFGITFAFGWLSTSLFHVATYVADARAQALPLVSVGGGAEARHDWHYLLSRLGTLEHDQLIAFFIRVVANGVMFLCIGFGAWLLWQMFVSNREGRRDTGERNANPA